MTTRNKLYLTNIGDRFSSAVNSPVTLSPHTITSSDVANGISIVDAFINVDASLVLEFTNPSVSTGCVFTLKQGPNIEGQSFDVNVNTDTGIGDQIISVPPASTVVLSVVDSSLYGQPTLSSDAVAYLGVNIDVSTTDVSVAATITAIGKYPQVYSGPA